MGKKEVRYILFLVILLAIASFPASAAVEVPAISADTNNTTTVPDVLPSAALSYGTLFPFHAILMTGGFLCFLAAATFPAFRKGKPGWLRNHQTLASAGTILSLAAFAVAFLMVGTSGGPHVRVPHAYLGVIVIIVIVTTFLLGLFRTRMKPYTIQAIAAHRWMGRVLLLLMAVTVISGLSTAGLLG